MRQEYYECHITLSTETNKSKDDLKCIVESIGWVFSCIDNDIVLGQGIKCYATKHFNKKFDIAYIMNEVVKASKNISYLGGKVIREKIELVLYDTK